jgi:thiamine-phosphate pyrophosphorylase
MTGIARETVMTAAFPDTDIYALTDSRQSLGRSTTEVAGLILSAGVKILQYREKDKDASVMLEECLRIREMTRAAGCCFIVNDHVDIALVCEADGVHVGQEDLPLAAVRRLVGKERIIGVSTHRWEEARAAVSGGADYIGVGPLFATATKRAAAPVGLAYLREAAAKSAVPFVAIGGINEDTAADVVRGGARCCAVVSAITLAEDIPAAICRLRERMREARSQMR